MLFLSLSFFFPAWADEGAPRFSVVTPLEGKDFVTGRKVVVPPGRGYKFSIAGAGTLRPYMMVYDADGLEVQAYFPLPSLIKAMTPEEKKEFEEKKKETDAAREKNATEELKTDISTGLQATAKGATVAKEGCCNVDDKKEEPEEAPAKEELAQEPKADEALEIESPPEDFVDVSPGAVEETAQEPAEEVKEPAKEPEEKVAEVEAAAPSDELANVPVPIRRPKDEKRSPALERPTEEFAQTPDLVPIPKHRPDLLNRASAPRGRGTGNTVSNGSGSSANGDADGRAEKDTTKPRRPASESICRAFDAFRSQGVPEKPLRQVLAFLDKNKGMFAGRRYVSIADYSQSSSKKRFYLLDMETKKAFSEKVSHGGGRRDSGDPDHDGMLNSCGGSGSERTRGGFFRVGDYYFSQKGRYKWPMLTRKPPRNGMKLQGLTPGVNASVFNDGYVMHEAKYNSAGSAKMGRSDGCPAFAPGHGGPILAKLRGGALQYHYTPMCAEHLNRSLKQIPGWENFCK